MTLCPSARRLGAEPRNSHTSSSMVGHSVGNSGHVVFALTTAVGHSVVRSIVTSYPITVPGLARHAFGEGHATRAGLTSGLRAQFIRLELSLKAMAELEGFEHSGSQARQPSK